MFSNWIRTSLVVSGAVVIGITCYYGYKRFYPKIPGSTRNRLERERDRKVQSSTPKPQDRAVIQQQDDEYFLSLMEDKMKEREKRRVLEEERNKREIEEWERAIAQSLLEQKEGLKRRELKELLEKVKREDSSDPNLVYYTCKIALPDGNTFMRRVLSTGTFGQLYDFLDTRKVDPDTHSSVFQSIPGDYVLLSDYPRVVHERDQVVNQAKLNLSKKNEFKLRVETSMQRPQEPKEGLSLV